MQQPTSISINQQAGMFTRAWWAARLLALSATVVLVGQAGADAAATAFMKVFVGWTPPPPRPFGIFSDLQEPLALGICIVLFIFVGHYNPAVRKLAALVLLLTLVTIAVMQGPFTKSREIPFYPLNWRGYLNVLGYHTPFSKPIYPIAIDIVILLIWCFLFVPLLKALPFDRSIPSLSRPLASLAGNVLTAVAAIFIASSVAAQLTPASPLPPNFLEVVGLSLVFGLPLVFLVRYVRRLYHARANKRPWADRRPPILLLRSFMDDRARIRPKGFIATLHRRRLRLEEVIGALVPKSNRFIAIGQPGEKIPQLGAAKVYFTEDSWRPEVLELMHQAKVIFIVVGSTPSVMWEIVQVSEYGHLRKSILMFPPTSENEYRTRFDMLRYVLDGADWDFETFKGTRAIHFASGSPTFIESKGTKQVHYELALLNALGAVLRSDAKRPGGLWRFLVRRSERKQKAPAVSGQQRVPLSTLPAAV